MALANNQEVDEPNCGLFCPFNVLWFLAGIGIGVIGVVNLLRIAFGGHPGAGLLGLATFVLLPCMTLAHFAQTWEHDRNSCRFGQWTSATRAALVLGGIPLAVAMVVFSFDGVVRKSGLFGYKRLDPIYVTIAVIIGFVSLLAARVWQASARKER